jgi:hypothetical protein
VSEITPGKVQDYMSCSWPIPGCGPMRPGGSNTAT